MKRSATLYLRIPQEVHAELLILAQRHALSLSDLVGLALRDWLAQGEPVVEIRVTRRTGAAG